MIIILLFCFVFRTQVSGFETFKRGQRQDFLLVTSQRAHRTKEKLVFHMFLYRSEGVIMIIVTFHIN